jgi:hypothetical protein
MEDEYNSYNQVTTDHQFVGETSEHDEPLYYDAQDHSVRTGDVDENGEVVPSEDGDAWNLDPEQEVGEWLEDVGEDHGWESLSEFARDHLEDDEANQR